MWGLVKVVALMYRSIRTYCAVINILRLPASVYVVEFICKDSGKCLHETYSNIPVVGKTLRKNILQSKHDHFILSCLLFYVGFIGVRMRYVLYSYNNGVRISLPKFQCDQTSNKQNSTNKETLPFTRRMISWAHNLHIVGVLRPLVGPIFSCSFRANQVRLLYQKETFQIGIVRRIFPALASIFVGVGVTGQWYERRELWG